MLSASFRVSPAPITGGSTLRSIELAGPAGRLEALLNNGAPQARYAAVVCHPHPLGGGTLHNKVVYHAMKALNSPEFGLEWPVLRFNFRGTGLSEGTHDGVAESGDVVAAMRWLENAYRLPLVVVGFSFGAAMALAACCSPSAQSDVRAIAALGLPTHAEGRDYRYPFLTKCSTPKLFLSGDRDQFASAAELEDVAATTAKPKKLVLLPGADHFFTGQLDTMQNELASWLQGRLS
ncbi:MAG: dienelactone hydrolase family protein [Terracidiphilus sp.]|nr:dienelactone hydrolase family protein [Terracidiphilus sp.]